MTQSLSEEQIILLRFHRLLCVKVKIPF